MRGDDNARDTPEYLNQPEFRNFLLGVQRLLPSQQSIWQVEKYGVEIEH